MRERERERELVIICECVCVCVYARAFIDITCKRTSPFRHERKVYP